MKLSRWLDVNNISQTEFATLVGVTRTYLCKILAGTYVPSRRLALKIEHATNGEVTAQEMLKI